MAKDPTNPPGTSKQNGSPKAASDRRTPVRLDSPRWLVPLMVAFFVIGLVWIVAYYVAPDAPIISSIGWFNVLIGFGFFSAGFLLSTKWK